MAERVLEGRSASPGLAAGRLARLAEAAPFPSDTGEDDQAGRLRAAIDRALRELEELAGEAGELGGEILALQIEMLADPELAAPALRAIAIGADAATGWREAMAAQIESFAGSEDATFKARSADLQDLQARVLACLAGRAPKAELPKGAIVTGLDLTPSIFLSLPWHDLGGAELTAGSAASHMAILARARGVPLVVQLGPTPDGDIPAILDATAGRLVIEPEPATLAAFARRLAHAQETARTEHQAAAAPARTADGEPVVLMANLDRPEGLSETILAQADGIGLFRTEFLFMGSEQLPDEEAQLACYAAVLRRLNGRPCIIRTLDIGGDKPVPGLQLEPESNPFLGLRGLRLCLERPALFRPQIRALLRAASEGQLKVMLPMVTTAGELDETRALFTRELEALRRAGRPAAMPPLGIMVEVPAAAIAIELFHADFFSIGSNDLTQYVMAASRDAGGRVGLLGDPLHPAVLRLIERVTRHGLETGLEVSLCGDMAGDPRAIPSLLAAGLRRLSVAPAALGRAKRAIALWSGRS